VLAKPGSLDQGFPLRGAACHRDSPPTRGLCTRVPLSGSLGTRNSPAAVAHGLTVALVGGDWMPFARLMVPVVPSLAMAIVLSARRATCWSTVARFVVAMSTGSFMLARGAPSSASRRRRPCSSHASAKPWLGRGRIGGRSRCRLGRRRDGRTGARSRGLTDPDIAALPVGIHRSAWIPCFYCARESKLSSCSAPRGLPGGSLSRWPEVECSRVVEARLVRIPSSPFTLARSRGCRLVPREPATCS